MSICGEQVLSLVKTLAPGLDGTDEVFKNQQERELRYSKSSNKERGVIQNPAPERGGIHRCVRGTTGGKGERDIKTQNRSDTNIRTQQTTHTHKETERERLCVCECEEESECVVVSR